MAISTWVYRKADGVFVRGGFYDPSYDPTTEDRDTFGEEHPDPRLERYDSTSPTKRRRATAQELASYDAAQAAVAATAAIDLSRTELVMVKLIVQQFNVLRALHSLPALTEAQVRQAFIDAWKALP